MCASSGFTHRASGKGLCFLFAACYPLPMKEQNPAPTLEVLRTFATHAQPIQFRNLRRPPVPSTAPATRELVDWTAQVYCYAWLRHMTTLANGAVILLDAGNSPASKVVGRS